MEKYFTNKPNEIIYFSQRNNAIFPMRSCFPTSLAMAMRNNGFSYYDKFKHPAYGTLELDDYIMYLSNSEVGNNIASMLKIPKGTPFLNEWWSVMAQVGNYLLKPQNMSCKWVTLDIAGYAKIGHKKGNAIAYCIMINRKQYFEIEFTASSDIFQTSNIADLKQYCI